MLVFFISLVISIMLAFGIAIALVEKGDDFPIKPWKNRLQLLLSKIHWKAPQMLECTTCTSFWACLLSDIIVCVFFFLKFGTFYFFWPFSGLIVLGITWYVIEHLNAIDKETNINAFLENKEGE